MAGPNAFEDFSFAEHGFNVIPWPMFQTPSGV